MPETRQSGGLVHRSPGSVNKPRSVEAEGEERVRVRAEAADRQAEQKKAFRSGGVCPGCVDATTTASSRSRRERAAAAVTVPERGPKEEGRRGRVREKHYTSTS
uniref:(northern house mosquito) hypothetical protein n=1 Tax=Culex pipiens TaxID=7175 RepID=A0A8D8JFC1_CULPI